LLMHAPLQVNAKVNDDDGALHSLQQVSNDGSSSK